MTPEELRDKALAVLTDYKNSVLSTKIFEGQVTLNVTGEHILDILTVLRDDAALSFNYLSDLTAVDHLEIGGPERFAVVYHLVSFDHNHRIVVKAFVPENNPEIQSATSLWGTADWQEREVWDLYGIKFIGHPNLTRLLNPEMITGHPLRKDYPMRGYGERDTHRRVEREVGSKYKPKKLD